jgi:hypothetical protein
MLNVELAIGLSTECMDSVLISNRRRLLILVYREYFTTLSTELKAFMTSILAVNYDSYKVLLDVQSRVPREFKPCWIQDPVILTDALGRVAPIHIELINSWDVFDSVLVARFVNFPGQGKVGRGEVAFQDRHLAKDIERSQTFETCFIPGRYIDMSMVFKQENSSTSCPKCGLEAAETSETAVEWYAYLVYIHD